LGTPAPSTTKTGRHDIAEILLNVALNTINQIKSYEGINGSHTNNLSSVKHETLITPSNYLHIFFHTYFISLLYVTNSYYPNSFNLSVYYAGCHFYRRVVPFSNNVFCAKQLRHRNVNIKLYMNQIYVNTIIHREFTLRKS
jgi:hypothetical protein